MDCIMVTKKSGYAPGSLVHKMPAGCPQQYPEGWAADKPDPYLHRVIFYCTPHKVVMRLVAAELLGFTTDTYIHSYGTVVLLQPLEDLSCGMEPEEQLGCVELLKQQEGEKEQQLPLDFRIVSFILEEMDRAC